MIQGRCPICGKTYSIAAIDDLPSFPFCSDRCRLIDLGRWVDGAYALPANPETPEESPAPDDEDEDER
jgi:endogenous inhibitor of DNA gyrase (YacG/DUF329 family)